MAGYNAFPDPDLSLTSNVGALAPGSLNSGNWGLGSVSGFYPTYAGGTDTTGASSFDLTKALNAASKGFGDSQKKDDSKPLPAAPIRSTPVGSPMQRVALDHLAQILNKRRDAVYASAMTPGGQAEPYVTPHTIGLLGF